MKPARSAGLDAALALLAGDVDLDQHLGALVAVAAELLEDGIGGDRVDQPAARQQQLHLAALQVADEVPLEEVAPALLLGAQVLLAVLADQPRRPPRPGRPSPRAGRTWSRPGPRPPPRPPPRTRARLAAILAGSSPLISPGHRSALPGARPGEPRLAAGDAAVAPVGEEEVPLAGGAEPRRLDRSTPGPGRAAGARPPAGRACRPEAIPAPERLERVEHLIAHLVAAGADARPDRRRLGPHRGGAAADDAGGEPAPAAMQDRRAARAREGDREAVGDVDEPGEAAAGEDVSVGLGVRAPRTRERARLLGSGVSRDPGAVDLEPGDDRARARGPSAAQSLRRFSITESRSSSVRTPRLRLSKGRS